MAPISEKIKFVTPDPYPKAKEIKGKDPAKIYYKLAHISDQLRLIGHARAGSYSQRV